MSATAEARKRKHGAARRKMIRRWHLFAISNGILSSRHSRPQPSERAKLRSETKEKMCRKIRQCNKINGSLCCDSRVFAGAHLCAKCRAEENQIRRSRLLGNFLTGTHRNFLSSSHCVRALRSAVCSAINCAERCDLMHESKRKSNGEELIRRFSPRHPRQTQTNATFAVEMSANTGPELSRDGIGKRECGAERRGHGKWILALRTEAIVMRSRCLPTKISDGNGQR